MDACKNAKLFLCVCEGLRVSKSALTGVRINGTRGFVYGHHNWGCNEGGEQSHENQDCKHLVAKCLHLSPLQCSQYSIAVRDILITNICLYKKNYKKNSIQDKFENKCMEFSHSSFLIGE